MYKFITLLFFATSLCFGTQIEISDMKQAESLRLKTLQKLHVAQAPLHSKQEKATAEEIKAYTVAVTEAVAFQKWVTSDRHCSILLKMTGNSSNDPINTKKYSKAIWDIHDAEIKVSPPFTRKDIGVAVKMMNDIRELFMLPVTVNQYSSMPDKQ
jgi:hypothetical protein